MTKYCILIANMSEDVAYAVLTSIDGLSADENRNTAHELTRHVAQELDVKHLIIQFAACDDHKLAYNGVLAAD